METANSHHALATPAHHAEELMRLANGAHDPATRIWRLMWARGFRMLAALSREPNDK